MKYFYSTLILFIFAASVSFSKNYKGAEYRTKEAYTYGRFEVRYKTSYQEGTLATFFTYHEISDISEWNEIDIEILGRYEDDVQFNPITPGQVNHVHHQYVNFNPAEDYHIYAFEWTPTYVAWFIDGKEVHRQKGAHIEALNLPQKIMMNIWYPEYSNWSGEFKAESLPAFAYYDWVSYYSYTPGTGDYGTDNNFSLNWKDDFDSFDSERWQKASHSFGGNGCDFIPENILFKDGKLILCLTDDKNIGYVDNNPPNLIFAYAAGEKIKINYSEDLEKSSAETISNYLLSGVTINSAKLLDDKRSVELDVTGLNYSNNYNLICRGIKDTSAAANIMAAKFIPLTMVNPAFPLKINTGDIKCKNYLPDQDWKHSLYGYMDGSAGNADANIDIKNTDEDSVFRSERVGLAKYMIRVPNGSYSVKIMMAENYFTEPGERVFDIYVNGNLAADNLDLIEKAGLHTALTISVDDVAVTNNLISIHFGAEANLPLVNGIIVENKTSGIQEGILNPQHFKLEQNYPNPFNGMTKIKYHVPVNDHLKFTVFDMLGRQIYSENIGNKSAGDYEINWGAVNSKNNSVSSGVYFYMLSGSEFSQTKKLMLLN